jgi:HrpA-like RNA helicase
MLQQCPAQDKNPVVSSPDPGGVGHHHKGSFARKPIPSIFEVAKLPMFGLAGAGSDRLSLSVTEMLLATKISDGTPDRAELRRQMLQISDVTFRPADLEELVTPPRDIEPAEDVSHLTLAPYKNHILDALRSNPAVVISAPTSSGKTTWLPRTIQEHARELFESGVLPEGCQPVVYCSVPRVIQTIKIAQYVSGLLGSPLGEQCGYLNSQTSRVSDGITNVVYLTHGYLEQLMLHRKIPDGSIIMIDEAHENPASLSPILLGLRRMISSGRAIKGVVMSATINAETFSNYLGEVPVIDPTEAEQSVQGDSLKKSLEEDIVDAANRGRNKKIVLLEALDTLEEDIVAAVDRGETPIVFVAGKPEIKATIDAVFDLDPTITCLPFHAKLPLHEQQRIFEPTPGERTAIIATNVGGTGLTYPAHVNTVIITDEVKSLIQLDGVDTLAYRPITRTEVVQLLGRIGRLEKDGTAILRLSKTKGAGPRKLQDQIPPEIQNAPLATMMLRHRSADRDLALDNRSFIFRASSEQLQQARDTLFLLDLVGPEGGKGLTRLGLDAASYPVDAPLGKLLARAERVREAHPNVLLGAIDIAASVEAEGIVPRSRRMWRELRVTKANSDMLAQFEVLQKAAGMTQVELGEYGIPEAQIYRAFDVRRSLRAEFGLEDAPDSVTLSQEEIKMLSEIVSSSYIPWLYRRIGGIKGGVVLYQGVHKGDIRFLSKGSVVKNAQYVVAYPFNLELKHVSRRLEALLERMGGYENTLPLLLHAHAVDTEWLESNLPPQFREAREAVKKDRSQGSRKKNRHNHRRPFRRRGN